MEIEFQEIQDFLASYPPFNCLSQTALSQLPAHIQIRYFRRGSSFPDINKQESSFFLVRSGAIEIRNNKQEIQDKLSKGDFYNQDCQKLDSGSGSSSGYCAEDSLVYLLPCSLIDELKSKFADFAILMNDSIEARLKHAVTEFQQSNIQNYHSMQSHIELLTDRIPLIIDQQTSIQQAAQLMSKEAVSSLLVTSQDKLVGLLTDKDLRNRCIATGLSINEPVAKVMTANLITLPHTTPLSDALLDMTRAQINHLPVLKDGSPVGILTTTDIVRHLSTNAAFIASDIAKANSVDALKLISQKLPELQVQLANSSASARHIGEVISSVTDAITRRLISMAEEKLGPAPVSYAWVASGSQARNEQSSHSDQDNALLLSDDYTEQNASYFIELAKFVSDGLNTCGYIYCPGNAMATNPEWRQPLSTWKNYFSKWVKTPEPMSLMLSSIFFDMRCVHGDKTLLTELQDHISKLTKDNEFFTAYLLSNALKHRPPLGFFRNFVLVHDGKHDDTLDIKHGGITPIVDTSRLLALSKGITTPNTYERLRLAAEAGAFSKEMCNNFEDAFEFICSLRIRHQAQQIRTGHKADNFLPPESLSGLERSHLKDAFKIIQTMQEYLANKYQANQLG